MRSTRRLSLFRLSLFLATSAAAAGCTLLGPARGEPAPATGSPYIVPRSEVRIMRASAGVEYRILVSRPATPPPASGYPVLYLLDGDDSFAIAATTADRLGRHAPRSGIVPGLIVAIGYPGASRRTYDYTPETEAPARGPDGRKVSSGGAEVFRAFIADELLPAIAREFPVDADRMTLMGHSYGGLFVLDTLFRRPGLFRTYVASSPSIWFGDGEVLRQEASFIAGQRNARRKLDLVLSVGELEQPEMQSVGAGGRIAADRRAPRRMVDDCRVLARRLRTLEGSGLSVHFRVLSGETHGTAPLPAIGAARRHAFGR